MKLRKILAAAMAVTIVCGAPAAVGTYQPGFELTVNAGDYTEVAEDGIKYKVYADYAEVARNEGIAGDVNIASAVNGVPVTSIGFRAFEECNELTSITIPDGVTSIDDRAFCECSELASITLPDSLTSIGDDAFVSCSKLTSITLPEGLTSIGCDAFDECSGLTSMTIPDSVTSIGYGAFYLCSGLTSIIIPDGVTSIGDWTFYGCSALTSVTIPESVTSISDKAFTDHSDVTICGYGGSYAETYAKANDIPFAAIEKAPATTTTTTTTSQPTTTTSTASTTTTSTAAQETTTTTATTPEQPAVSLGDPTGDGKIDAKDASFALVEYAKLSTGGESSLTDAERSAADVNKDGKVDSKDASAILTYYAYTSTGGTESVKTYLSPSVTTTTAETTSNTATTATTISYNQRIYTKNDLTSDDEKIASYAMSQLSTELAGEIFNGYRGPKTFSGESEASAIIIALNSNQNLNRNMIGSYYLYDTNEEFIEECDMQDIAYYQYRYNSNVDFSKYVLDPEFADLINNISEKYNEYITENSVTIFSEIDNYFLNNSVNIDNCIEYYFMCKMKESLGIDTPELEYAKQLYFDEVLSPLYSEFETNRHYIYTRKNYLKNIIN